MKKRKKTHSDDRALVVRPGENYLAWLLPALCTASGHYLSIHKGKGRF